MAKTSPIEYADRILSKDLPPIIKYNKELYLYDPSVGYYSVIDSDDLDQLVHDFFVVTGIPTLLTPTLSSQIVWAMRLSPRIKKVKTLNDHGTYINLKNGMINLDEPASPLTLLPHSPDFYFTSAVNIDYDPTANQAPYFISTLQAIFRNKPGDPEPHDQESVNSIIRLGGYILYPQNKIKKMFIFFGGGANGKSIIMEHVFKKFFTKENMTALSLNTLSSEASFARHKLMTSRINFATEQKAGSIESEELKKIISGETIAVDRKNKDWVDFEPNCKILIAANRLPYFKDTTHGTDRRLHIIYFPNRFMHKKDYDKEEDHAMRGIYIAENEDEMTAKLTKELPAILNLFIIALQELKNNGWYFPTTANSTKIKEDYKEESDPVGSWLKRVYKRTKNEIPANIVTTQKLLKAYEDYLVFSGQTSKKGGLTTTFISKKVKEVFGISSFRYYQRNEIIGKPTNLIAFYLEENDDILI